MNPLRAAGPSRFGDEHRPWLDALEAIGPPPREFRLPDPASVPGLFRQLAIDERDAHELRSLWPAPARDPEFWWLLERAHHLLVRSIGGFDHLGWPRLPPAFGAAGRYFWAYVFLAAFPDVRAYHARRAIADEVAIATLADLGRNLKRDRRLFGEGGLRTHDWLTLHFRGAIYELGRLQFNRMRARSVHAHERSAGLREGDPAIGIHIPEGGPLSPEACDESLRLARRFFAEHFRETPVRIGLCTSWLLDEQLGDYLDPGSNIIAFQQRFRLIGTYDGDADILRFVFGRVGAVDLDTLPQRTTLERAIVAHLRAGKHWRNRVGWLEL